MWVHTRPSAEIDTTSIAPGAPRMPLPDRPALERRARGRRGGDEPAVALEQQLGVRPEVDEQARPAAARSSRAVEAARDRRGHEVAAHVAADEREDEDGGVGFDREADAPAFSVRAPDHAASYGARPRLATGTPSHACIIVGFPATAERTTWSRVAAGVRHQIRRPARARPRADGVLQVREAVGHVDRVPDARDHVGAERHLRVQ